MQSFRKSEFINTQKQAISIVKDLHDSGKLGSARTYYNTLNYCREIANNMRLLGMNCNLKSDKFTVTDAKSYLSTMTKTLGQKTLDGQRLVLQQILRNQGKLGKTETLRNEITNKLFKADKQPKNAPRAYTLIQVEMIVVHQNEMNSLATQIAAFTGLRAHELYTLRPIDEQPPTAGRPVSEHKFKGLIGEYKPYTVIGKGGLIRVVMIPKHLVDKLEKTKLDTPKHIKDRGVDYYSHYNISGGYRWSKSFSQTSKRILNWSTGAHGLRHMYAQMRMLTLQNTGLSFKEALGVVSQEMGHFRSNITLVYLR